MTNKQKQHQDFQQKRLESLYGKRWASAYTYARAYGASHEKACETADGGADS